MTITTRRLTRDDFALMPGLVALLQDAVDHGASVGFLAPLDNAPAWDYWLSVMDRLESGLLCWIALEGQTVAGTVQLEPCGKQNGRHRAEVMKLLTLASKRRRGIAAGLMQALESEARFRGLKLLFLDTEAQSPAERFYQSQGWARSAEIPCYALTAQGQLCATVFYFKVLT
jgi:acetyltransferase